jgi:hypothetical protein
MTPESSVLSGLDRETLELLLSSAGQMAAGIDH